VWGLITDLQKGRGGRGVAAGAILYPSNTKTVFPEFDAIVTRAATIAGIQLVPDNSVLMTQPAHHTVFSPDEKVRKATFNSLKDRPSAIADISCLSLLVNSLQEWPDAALIDGQNPLLKTTSQFLGRTISEQWLEITGAIPKDRIKMLWPNKPETREVIMASLRRLFTTGTLVAERVLAIIEQLIIELARRIAKQFVADRSKVALSIIQYMDDLSLRCIAGAGILVGQFCQRSQVDVFDEQGNVLHKRTAYGSPAVPLLRSVISPKEKIFLSSLNRGTSKLASVLSDPTKVRVTPAYFLDSVEATLRHTEQLVRLPTEVLKARKRAQTSKALSLCRQRTNAEASARVSPSAEDWRKAFDEVLMETSDNGLIEDFCKTYPAFQDQDAELVFLQYARDFWTRKVTSFPSAAKVAEFKGFYIAAPSPAASAADGQTGGVAADARTAGDSSQMQLT